MRRGDIYLVDFDPTRGSEANKRRPAIIVSNDVANSTATSLGSGVVTVVPVTSNVERVYPFQVFLPAATTGLGRDAKAQAEQLRSVSVDRVIKQRGEIPPDLMRELDLAIRLHLAL